MGLLWIGRRYVMCTQIEECIMFDSCLELSVFVPHRGVRALIAGEGGLRFSCQSAFIKRVVVSRNKWFISAKMGVLSLWESGLR